MSGVKLGGRESDLTIPECGLANHGIMLYPTLPLALQATYMYLEPACYLRLRQNAKM